MVLHLLTSGIVLAIKISLLSGIMCGYVACGGTGNVHCATLLQKCLHLLVYESCVQRCPFTA